MKCLPPRLPLPGVAPAPQKGFTLVELLVVLAIMGLLASLAMQAVRSIGASRGVTKGLDDLASLLEFARSEAVGRQTYVWVGFENASDEGTSELRAVAVASKDGSVNAKAANLLTLTKVAHIRNIVLTDWSSLKVQTRSLAPGNQSVSVDSNPNSIPLQVGAASFTKSLTFTPRGEALLAGNPDANTPYDNVIDVSLRQTQGLHVPENGEDAALLLDGGTGTLRKIRIQ